MSLECMTIEHLADATVGRDYRHDYVDTGCRRARRFHRYYGPCLECPLPKCLEDARRAQLSREGVVERRDEIMRMIEHANVKEIAEHLGVTRRTVYYHLRLGRRLVNV